MEQRIIYVANDGSTHYSADAAITREEIAAKVAAIMSGLIATPVDDNCNFSNGGGFIQQDKEVALRVRRDLLKLMKMHINHHWIQQSIDDPTIHPSWVGRIVSDYDIKPLWQAWGRFSCMDKDWKEYGQPYYANHPDKAEQVQIEP